MADIIAGVKKFSPSMFFVFVFSKLLVGIGIGVLLAQQLASFGLWFLIVGVVLSIICLVAALKQ